MDSHLDNMDPQDRLDKLATRRNYMLAKIPKPLNEMLSYMQSNIRKQFRYFSIFAMCGSSEKSRFIIQQQFQKSFQHLSIQQKLDLYQKAIKHGMEVFNDQQHSLSRQELDFNIQTQLNEALDSSHKEFHIQIHGGFKSNAEANIKIQRFKLQSKGNFTISLQNYLLRRSKKKYSQSYVLSAINKAQPESIRFSFGNAVEEKVCIRILKALADLAFKSSIVSMLASQKNKGPSKPPRNNGNMRSIGRMKQLQVQAHNQSPFMSQDKLKDLDRNGKAIIQFSRKIGDKRREANKSKANGQLVGQLLNSSRNRQQPRQIQPQICQDNQNIFNKVLQSQNDIKQTLTPQVKHHNYNSPIRRLITSEVQLYPLITMPPTKRKNIFQLMLPDFNLRQFQLSISSKSFKQIYMTTTSNGHNFTIFQHIQKKQRFKCSFIVENIPIDQIYLILINGELLKKWNKQVDQSQIKIKLTTQNCLICYEKHKRYSNWFKERDYLFIRHPFTYKGCKYIADRSIQHTSFIPFHSIQRGYIRHAVTRLKQMKDLKTQVIVDFSVDHEGYLGIDKKKQLNLNYLKQYQKLSAFISNNGKQSFCNKIYCDLDWNIDWIDLVQNQGSFPSRSLSIGTQQFNITSEIDQSSRVGNFQQESEQFYSVKDNEDPNQAEYHFQTTNKSKGFNRLQSQQLRRPKDWQQQQPKNQSQIQIYNQIQHEENTSVYNQPSVRGTPIILDEQGYCVLPMKYIKKKHMRSPIQKQDQERIRKYPNIVLKDDFVENSEGGLLLVNKKKIQAQDNVMNFIIKTMKKNLFSGKSILSISLPVQIFKQDSNTQRLCQSMSLGPQFLQKAARMEDPLQRMKWVICFGLSNSIMYFYIEKPFNPILGQTFQGVIDGCPIYAEQVSHHPPISSLYFLGRGYRVYANIQAKVFLYLNSGEGVNFGYYTIQFDDGHKVKFQTAPGELSGFTIGDRKYRYKDRMYIYDTKNRLYSELLFQDPETGFFSKGKWDHGDQMGGQIVKVTPEFIQRFQGSAQKIHPKPKNIEQVLSKIEGRWIHYLGFDGKKYYDILDDLPYQMINYEYPLHSDARYRQDLIYRTKNDLVKSQINKEYLQNKQRKDRKLRQQYHGKGH